MESLNRIEAKYQQASPAIFNPPSAFNADSIKPQHKKPRKKKQSSGSSSKDLLFGMMMMKIMQNNGSKKKGRSESSDSDASTDSTERHRKPKYRSP